jgi:hypothetical protein
MNKSFNLNWDEGIGYNRTIGEIRGHERFVYWYNITPKNYGLSELKTIINTRSYSDIENKRIIEVKKSEPKLNVYPVIDKTNVIQNEKVLIKYYITCLNEQDYRKNWTILLKLEKPNYRYFEYADPNENLTLIKNIQKFQTIMIPIEVVYPDQGKYYPPLIFINDVPYLFSDQIIVEPFFTKHSDFFSMIFTVLSILIALLYFYIDNKKGTRTWKSLIKGSMKNNFFSTILFSYALITLSTLVIIGQIDSTFRLNLIIIKNMKLIVIGLCLMLITIGFYCYYYLSRLEKKLPCSRNKREDGEP